jgi:muconolactone delta-isomerase
MKSNPTVFMTNVTPTAASLMRELQDQVAKNKALVRALNRAVEQARTWKQLGENANYQLRFELAKK